MYEFEEHLIDNYSEFQNFADSVRDIEQGIYDQF
jgi:hypothetical protein